MWVHVKLQASVLRRSRRVSPLLSGAAKPTRATDREVPSQQSPRPTRISGKDQQSGDTISMTGLYNMPSIPAKYTSGVKYPYVWGWEKGLVKKGWVKANVCYLPQ